MTVEKLRELTKEPGVIPLHLNHVSFGDKIRLCKTAGPLGIILSVHGGKTMALFDNKKIRNWLDKNFPA